SAGTYTVTFTVSDGLHQVSGQTTLLIAQGNQAPTLVRPADVTAGQGEPVRIPLQASDPDGDALTFSSPNPPPGAALNPATGLFTWTPGFAQQGTFAVPIAVSDGTNTATQTMNITVTHVDAPPVFAQLGTEQVQEGQAMRFTTFAFDPHNPGFIPQRRL